MGGSLPHGQRQWLPILAGIVVWLGSAALILVLFHYMDAKSRLEASAGVRAALGEARQEVFLRLQGTLSVPETLAAMISAQERVDKRTFESIVSRLIRDNPSIRNVALAPGNVIRVVHPLAGNEAALGLQYAQLPDQYPAVQQAMRTRRTVVTGPITLVQGGVGVVSRTPVFLRGKGGRDTRYWGIVALAVGVDRLFADLARVAEHNRVEIAVRRADPGQPPGPAFFGSGRVFEQQPVANYYPLQGGGRWELAAIPRGGWTTVQSVPLPLRVLVQGVALLLGWVAYHLLASQDRDRRIAGRDALTGLLNRKSFDRDLAEILLHAPPRSCALVLFDLDGFKPINDTYGHRAGDVVLQRVAERLQSVAHEGDSVYRLGGDEFAMLLQGERSTRDLFQHMERAQQLVREPVQLPDRRRVSVGASAGVAVFPSSEEPERADEVFDRADRALYRAKAQASQRARTVADAADSVR